jgi:phage N-6-adenine-methyltransferase
MANDYWATPLWLFEYAKSRYGHFDLDVCAVQESAKCESYYTPEDNSLVQPWAYLNWCNPPYSNITPWVQKAALETNLGNRTIMLLPSDFSTQWFKLVWDVSSEILIFNKRIQFIGAKGSPPFGSFLCFITPESTHLDRPYVDLIDSKSLVQFY